MVKITTHYFIDKNLPEEEFKTWDYPEFGLQRDDKKVL